MSPRAARLALGIFTALVAASIGIALAGLTWRLLGDPGRRLDAAPPAAAAAAPVDVAPLIALAPFGTGGGAASAAAAPDLVLRGILLTTPREASTAIIQAGGAPSVAVAAGQALGGTTVATIEADHVVLLGPGGARQTLAFPRPAGGEAAPVPPPPAPLAPGAAPAAPAATGGPPSAAAFVQNLGGTLAGDGFRVGATPGPAARAAGLQPGDVIQRINDGAVAELLANPAALSAIAAAGSARLELMRGAQRLTLVVPLR